MSDSDHQIRDRCEPHLQRLFRFFRGTYHVEIFGDDHLIHAACVMLEKGFAADEHEYRALKKEYRDIPKQTTRPREYIRCPECDHVQLARVEYEYWMPGPLRVHRCVECGYLITDSTWEAVKPTRKPGVPGRAEMYRQIKERSVELQSSKGDESCSDG